jgi:PRTRC genetic system protein B
MSAQMVTVPPPAPTVLAAFKDALAASPLTEGVALVLLGGDYLLLWQEGQQVQSKLVAPAAVKAAIALEQVDSGWMSGVRRWGMGPEGEWAVLYQPPARHPLLVVDQAHPQGELITVALPGLVWYGCGRDYRLFAIGEEELSPGSALYHAPLPNIYGDGRLCWGNLTPPMAAASTLGEALRLFLTSAFTDHLAQGKSVQEKANVLVHLRKVARRRRRRYPVADLVPIGGTLDQALEKMHSQCPTRW